MFSFNWNWLNFFFTPSRKTVARNCVRLHISEFLF